LAIKDLIADSFVLLGEGTYLQKPSIAKAWCA